MAMEKEIERIVNVDRVEDLIAVFGSFDENIKRIEEALDVELGLKDVDTFTGLVFNALDMIPGDGEQDIELDFNGLHIHITRVEDHQIVYATVTKSEQPTEEDSNED